MITTQLGDVEVVEAVSKFGLKEPAKLSAILNHCWAKCINKSVQGTLRVMFEVWENYNNETKDDIIEKCDVEHYYITKLILRMDGCVEYYLSNGRVETVDRDIAKKWGVPIDDQMV